jgi:osmotically-inducible protein OsmY
MTDIHLRDAVRRQLDWDPEVDGSASAVTARKGAVSLTGFIDTYWGKLAAERSVKAVHGVRAVANGIDVRLRLERTDADVAQDVAHALQLHSAVPDRVQASVRDGHVTLTGKATWLHQKEAAVAAVEHIRGVRSVVNHITIDTGTQVLDIRHRIVAALHRMADVDARHIAVTATGQTARLSGMVGTWLQRECAERAAMGAPGVTHVVNDIEVQSFHDAKVIDFDEQC